MIAHFVSLKFVAGTGAEHIDEAWRRLTALVELVPTLHQIVGGRDLGYDNANAQLSFVAFFDDHAGWLAYQQHPAHQSVAAELIRPYLESRVATQCEWASTIPA